MPATEEQLARAAEHTEDPFRTNALLIIREMVKVITELMDVAAKLIKKSTVLKGEATERAMLALKLCDEILHSIFFLGKINDPQHPPESIVANPNMLAELKSIFPRPFNHFSSQLPKRSPFSCVLDMIVLLIGQQNEREIKEKVQEITKQLRRGRTSPLISSTICVSRFQNSDRYYGVSMSTAGRIPGRIMVAASCLSYWDSYVAGAVMTYYPNKTKKTYFDGTIKLPENVRCEAFDICEGQKKTPKPPCGSCMNLFGLKTQEWAYGNCAEVESLSNLFKNIEEVREQARPTSANSTEENRQRAERSVQAELRRFLEEHNFTWDGNFFTPQ